MNRSLVSGGQSAFGWRLVRTARGRRVQPDDAHVYRSAARLRVDRAAAQLAAEQRDWLVALIGTRPASAMPAQVWGDAVRDLATHQLRFHEHLVMPDLAGGLWDRIAAMRVRLAVYTDAPAVPAIELRDHAQLVTRRRELDAIFESAPADYRKLITELRDGGQLSFDDTTQLLVAALAAQDARTRWILAHWPHVVEYAETARALAPVTAQVADESLRRGPPQLLGL